MKSMKLLFTLLFVAAFATVSLGQITNSAHDFKGDGWNASDEICVVCHTPHNASGVAGAVLWNHAVTATDFSANLYVSGTLESAAGAPAGNSLLCLSCHDGSIGLEDFGGATGGINKITGDALVGTDLSNDHPISISYTTAIATSDGSLANPSVVTSGLGGTITEDLLSADKVECSSCHDVHNAGNNGFLLRIANTGSALCLTCHTK